MIRKLRHIIWIFCIAVPATGQLAPILDMYQLNGLAINPAYAGSQEALSVGIHSRIQWSGFDGAPRSAMLSGHAPVNSEKVNLGMILLGNRFGSKTETGFLLNYAYRIRMDQGKFSMGLAAGVSSFSSDMDAIRFADPGDPLLQDPARRVFLPQFSLGAYYYSERLYLGFSMPFFMSYLQNSASGDYQIAFLLSEATYLISAGYLFQASEKVEILPSALLRICPANGAQLDLRCDVIYDQRFMLGACVRTNGQLSALVQVQVNPQFRIGYAYGYELSPLSSYQNGSHEVGLFYSFRYLINAVSPRYF